MRKSSLTLFLIISCLAANAWGSPFQMPDVKGQLKKTDLKGASAATLQADQVSFSTVDNKAHASGNVVVNSRDQHLFCDQLELDRTIQQVVAEGNVYLDTPQEQVVAQGLTYNFNDRTGQFRNARVYIDPYQIKGQKIDKISEDHMAMDEGYLTTCDLDEPHYRIGAHRMDIYQKDRAVIHGMKVYLGTIPIMYLPYYVQDLKNRPLLTFEPGERKEFGLFLLTTARFRVGSHVQVALHGDIRERDGFGEGVDIRYNTPNFGSGLLSVYYTDENQIAGRHLWDEYRNGVKVGPTTHHERYRMIWRHKWQIDKNTNAVVQYYKIHDYDILNQGFLKNYFPRDYQQNAQNSNYDTYLLLTRNMPHGTLTFNIETSRLNPQIQGVERIPEIQYTLNNTQIGKSGFYAKSTDTFSDLSLKTDPATVSEKTLRIDSNNDFSHPFKVGFIQFNPHLGNEETYYSRTADITRDNIMRGMFRGSLDMSTKFYRVWDYHTNFAGLDINGLRHVITPTITYLYQARPTFPASRLDQFDTAIDDLYRIHEFEIGLENKLQTKRDGKVVDLARLLITTDYGLKGTTGHRGFNPYDALLDFNPNEWLTLHDEYIYDTHIGHVDSNNFEFQVHNEGWSFAVGDLYTWQQGNQLTTQWDYTINPKWNISIYNTIPLVQATSGTPTARAYQYVITRDLHEWQMDLGLNQQQGSGSTFYVLFRLKASPGMKFNLFTSSFQAARPGGQ